MKLLFFIHSLSGGGAERVTTNLANYWAGLGWQVTIVTVMPPRLDAYALHPGIERIALDLAGESSNRLVGLFQNLHRIRSLRKILKRVRPDVAVGMMTMANIVLAWAAWGLRGVTTIGSERVHPPQYPVGALWEFLRRHSYGALSSVVALTSESAAWLRQNTRVRRVDVIPNAASWPLPMLPPTIAPDSLCPVGRRLMLGVGRLEVQKGFDWLIDAFAAQANRHPDWDLVIVGEGPERKGLQDRVNAAGLAGRVFLPGRAGNMPQWYERADLYVLSSRFEGFPNTLVEAMMYGTPVVSFDCDTGPRDIIRPEVDGLLVPVGDVGKLGGALDRLMGDRRLRDEMANRAPEVKTRFSIGEIASAWQSVFEGVRSERS